MLQYTPPSSPFFEDNDRFMEPFEEMDKGNRDAG